MTAEPVHPDLVRIALDKVEGTEFERFVNAFYPAISGSSFVPWAGSGTAAPTPSTATASDRRRVAATERARRRG